MPKALAQARAAGRLFSYSLLRSPDQVREDSATTETLIGMGYIVIRFHHEDDWLAIFRRHSDVFGTLQD